MKNVDNTSIDDTDLTERDRCHLADIAHRMGVAPQLALEIAINRMHVAFFSRVEGELSAVDFSQSLPWEALGPNATSVSLPGCQDL